MLEIVLGSYLLGYCVYYFFFYPRCCTSPYSAGLKAGDIITHINDQPVKSSQELYDRVQAKESLKVTAVRGKETMKLTITPEESQWNETAGIHEGRHFKLPFKSLSFVRLRHLVHWTGNVYVWISLSRTMF